MEDLKIYYKTSPHLDRINYKFEKKIIKLAKKFGLTFTGSGVEIETGIRDLHFIKE